MNDGHGENTSLTNEKSWNILKQRGGMCLKLDVIIEYVCVNNREREVYII